MAKPDLSQTATLKIRVTGPEQGRYRGGFGTVRKFTPEVQEFTDLDLSPEEIDELKGDTELKVEVGPIVPEAPAN